MRIKELFTVIITITIIIIIIIIVIVIAIVIVIIIIIIIIHPRSPDINAVSVCEYIHKTFM